MKPNRDKIFAELIAVEGWHSAFDGEGRAQLHVDVTFRKGMIGEDPDSKVRFEISTKRAEVFFVFTEAEGIAVIQSSVEREQIPKGTVLDQRSSAAVVKGRIAASVSPTALTAAGAASASAERGHASAEEIQSEIRPIMSRQFRSSDGYYAWELYGAFPGKPLVGKAWDPQAEPRLAFKRRFVSRIPPISRIQVKCRRDDLQIENIEIKGKKVVSDRFKKNRIAAAEAAIKAILEQQDLEAGNLSEKYAPIRLAEVLVEEEVT